MFNKLREKLKNWTKNFSKQIEITKEREEDEIAEEKSIREVKLATEFDTSPQKSEPILEKLEEKVKEIEEKKEQEEEEKIPGKPGFFKRIFSKVTKVKISGRDFEVYAEELEFLLLENNVALEVVEKVIEQLKKQIVGKEILKKEVESEINQTLKEILREILIEPFELVQEIKHREEKSKPYVVLFCGINGTGKTTTIAKIAHRLKENNISCVLAAGDTFRSAAIEQLKKHGEQIGVEVIASKYGADPAAIAFEAVKYAEKKHIDCVLIDTAGRMHTSKNLMMQIEKIKKVCKPNKKIFVGEAITGNDAIEQIKGFDEIMGIDGIILTKADIDEKGGTALSVGYVTKKPIIYLGTGQEYDKIEPFDKQKFIEKLGLENY